ncbi:orexin/Hypocretin receptor type 1 isoform X2 [Phlebotomus papatasi]|uniref:orexin/Hypocretin receptor type 1 isoform X2 n=1 Tax=Phlebotomus papatasi TaxID=29031 RepID=UPI0024845063|nr:orexin/Hypocretin receptor type 1 isoform X2 [Phlebotomus papatasi]XP_055712350.1 orexin/Hypocretin receptor type 1 isoform X2 [Phlebotomus papatasi]
MVNSRTDLETEMAEEIPEHWLATIANYVLGFRNDTLDFTVPILKPVAVRFYPIFILQYGVLLVIGLLSNIAVIAYIMHYKLFRDVTHSFIVNLAFCHVVQCSVVLPITLMVLLIQNWVFGQFLCFFLPLLQDIPLHVAIITHLLIAWDRMRWLMDPLKARLPAFVCSCATWLAGMVIALPYPIYTTYLDLGMYLKQFRGVGICAVNLVDDMQEYMRGLFVIMYCAPVTILSYLYIRTSRELREPDGPLDVLMFEARVDTRNIHQRSLSTSANARSGRGNTSSGSSGTRRSSFRTHQQRSYDLYDAELDVCREKRTQRFLGAMAAVHVICVCPLMIMRLARMALVETYENSTHFDLTYLMFVWMAFLPTTIIPWLYGSWVLSRPVKERLRGYFRLSSRRSNNSIPKTNEPRLSTTEDFVSQDVTTEISHIQESNSRHGDSFTRKHSRRRDHRRSSNSEGASTASRGSRSNSVGRQTKRDSNASSDLREVSPFNERKCTAPLEGKPVTSFAYRKSSFLLDTNSTVSNDPSFPGSTSTLEHDLEIIDLLERERSMDIQEMLHREALEEQNRIKCIPGQRILPEISSNRGLVSSPQILSSSRGSTRRVRHKQLAKDIDRRDLQASRARRTRRTNWLKSTN